MSMRLTVLVTEQDNWSVICHFCSHLVDSINVGGVDNVHCPGGRFPLVNLHEVDACGAQLYHWTCNTETCACVRAIIPLYQQPQLSLGQAQRRVPVSSTAWVRHRDMCLCQAQPGSGTETCACVKHSLGQAQRRVPVSSTARVRHRDVCLCQTDYTFIPATTAQPGSGTETCACVRLIIPLYLQPQHSLGQAQRRVPVSDWLYLYTCTCRTVCNSQPKRGTACVWLILSIYTCSRTPAAQRAVRGRDPTKER